MSIRTHFCVVQCCSIWNPDPHHGFVDASLFSAIWHALGGKRGLERPGLDVAVTALTGGELTVGDEFWARHGGIGVTSDAFLQALITCKDRVCGPEFRWLPQAPPQSVAEAHAWLLNSVAHYAERLESDAVVLFGWNLGIPTSARTHSRSFAPAATTPCSVFPAKCRTETCAVLQVVLLAVLCVVLEVHAETSLWTSRIPMMSSVCRTGDCRPAPVIRCTSAGHTRKEREATNEKWTEGSNE